MHDTLPQTPGALLGYRKNGQPIHLIAGGNGEGDPAAPPADPPAAPPQADPAPANPPAPTPPAQPAPGAPAPAAVAELPDWAQKLITDTRKEAGDNRVKAREAEAAAQAAKAAVEEFKTAQEQQRDALAKALGLKQDDTPPDPKVLAEQVTAANAELARRDEALRQKTVELAVLQTAGKQAANGAALLDSRAFLTKIAGLDPSAADFSDQVAATIKDAVEANPQYKLTPATPPKKEPTTPKSGGEFTSPPGAPRQWTDEDVLNATPAETTKAMEQGLLQNLGFGSPRRSRR